MMGEWNRLAAAAGGERRIGLSRLKIGFSSARRSPKFAAAMDSKELALACRELADDKKADDIVILDLRKLPGVTDFMVLCTGTSDPHLRAIEEEIVDKLRDRVGVRPRAVDGTRHSGWIVLDYVDVLVHVMRPDVRAHYDLEGLWNDAPRVRPRAARATATRTPRAPRVKAEGEGAAPAKRVRKPKKAAAATPAAEA